MIMMLIIIIRIKSADETLAAGKFRALHGTRRFIAVFTTAGLWTLS
jgi:hypothetical protein